MTRRPYLPKRLTAIAVTFMFVLPFTLLTACIPREIGYGDAGASPPGIDLTADRWIATDGYELPRQTWAPDGKPKAVIVALHGFNDYANAFAEPGTWLAERGIAVYAYDQRGFGRTADASVWPGANAMVNDLRSMLAAVRDAHPGVPLHVLGDSMGSAVVLAAWAEAPLDVDGVILVAPAIWGRAAMPGYMQTSLWFAAHTVPWMKLTGQGLDILASDNIEMLRALGADPLVIKETRIDAMWGLVNLMDRALNAADDFDAPGLILVGARDEIVPPHASHAFLQRRDAGDHTQAQTLAIYENGWHMLLRDLQAETVWRDVLSWIEDPSAPLPSGADEVDRELLLDPPTRRRASNRATPN